MDRLAPVLMLLALVGCGRSLDLPRARAPRLDDDALRCQEAARRNSPIVTEWSAAEKASLQARLRRGALAVEFTGCSMRPLPGCTVPGVYRWQRTTLSTDTIEVQSDDELFAKLPLGAATLEGELARSGRLAVQTTVGGQIVLEGARAADVPAYGECAAATHLLTGLSIGAFQLRSGGALRAGASVAVAGAGGAARTASAEQLLQQSGDPASCAASTDEAPELGCSAPIQAFLEPLPRYTALKGTGTMRATFSADDASRPWELRQGQEFVCKLPCTRWVTPEQTFQLRAEDGPVPVTIDVTELREHATANEVDVRTYPRDAGMFTTGIVVTGVGGAAVFLGGFLGLMGGLGERDGLAVAGGVAATAGAIAVAPGVWMIVESGARTEVTPLGALPPGLSPAPPRLGVAASF